MIEQIKHLIAQLSLLPEHELIQAINEIKMELHQISPFRNEPVDCVLWVKNETIHANDYNPNEVAPVEMDLLDVSITEDGYTQPIVTFDGEVVDGFHRNRIGKEREHIRQRLLGYLPIVNINDGRTDKADRMASTIRHNRARGKHKVSSMSDIVVELKRRNWSNEKISKHLGMDADEVLRLQQVSGLAEMFSDREYSEAWSITITEDGE